ncbi:MAG TPA: phosphoenolpyruvate carboxykinase (ATP), partial [Planctomycetota bacterium]|nr:phosphoenolpyruvate carboxykinase (ATP) [Planctomycetota bacterium]
MPATGVYRALPDLEPLGITHPGTVYHDLSTPALVEEAVKRSEAQIAEFGPLVINTGKFTGRAVQDRFIVDEPASRTLVNWGKVNRPISEAAFDTL